MNASSKIAAAVDGVGSVLRESSAKRNKSAKMALQMRLIGKAGLSKKRQEKAYRKMLDKLVSSDTDSSTQSDTEDEDKENVDNAGSSALDSSSGSSDGGGI